MMIYKAEGKDIPTVTSLASFLWPDNEPAEFMQEFTEMIGQEECAVFLAEVQGESVGFAQCQLRYDYVEGTSTSPVGYLEGIYVAESARRSGVAKALLRACEDWAKELGCTEFASDCELDNEQSQRFHEALGFVEANRIVCFTKKL